MLKLKSFINVLLVVTISICLHQIDSSFAGDCADKEDGAGTPTFTGDHNYSENWNTAPELDPGIPEEIAPSSSIPLTVSGGCAPYIWSVSGTGFTLETEGEPTGPTNTLYADGTACGAITITVTGCDGTEVTGYVRCTTGLWNYANKVVICGSDLCMGGGPGGCVGVNVGIYQWWTACSGPYGTPTNCNEWASIAPCGSLSGCQSQGGHISNVCYVPWTCP